MAATPHSRLARGAVAGIVVACVLAVIVVACALPFVLRARRKKQPPAAALGRDHEAGLAADSTVSSRHVSGDSVVARSDGSTREKSPVGRVTDGRFHQSPVSATPPPNALSTAARDLPRDSGASSPPDDGAAVVHGQRSREGSAHSLIKRLTLLRRRNSHDRELGAPLSPPHSPSPDLHVEPVYATVQGRFVDYSPEDSPSGPGNARDYYDPDCPGLPPASNTMPYPVPTALQPPMHSPTRPSASGVQDHELAARPRGSFVMRSPSPPAMHMGPPTPEFKPPERQPTQTINPRDVMLPTNDTEKDEWVKQELDRMQKMPLTPERTPEHDAAVAQQATPAPSPPPAPPVFLDEPMSPPPSAAIKPEFSPMVDLTMDMDDDSLSPGMGWSGPSNENTPTPNTTAHDSDAPEASQSPSPLPPDAEIQAIDGAVRVVLADGTENFICSVCGAKFPQLHRLNHHKRYHEKPHACPYRDCDRSFGTRTHLDRHINDRHAPLYRYFCPEISCAYSRLGNKHFTRKDNLRRHMQNIHGHRGSFNPDPELIEQIMQA